jgi:hypothetical protein
MDLAARRGCVAKLISNACLLLTLACLGFNLADVRRESDPIKEVKHGALWICAGLDP